MSRAARRGCRGVRLPECDTTPAGRNEPAPVLPVSGPPNGELGGGMVAEGGGGNGCTRGGNGCTRGGGMVAGSGCADAMLNMGRCGPPSPRFAAQPAWPQSPPNALSARPYSRHIDGEPPATLASKRRFGITSTSPRPQFRSAPPAPLLPGSPTGSERENALVFAFWTESIDRFMTNRITCRRLRKIDYLHRVGIRSTPITRQQFTVLPPLESSFSTRDRQPWLEKGSPPSRAIER